MVNSIFMVYLIKIIKYILSFNEKVPVKNVGTLFANYTISVKVLFSNDYKKILLIYIFDIF